MAGKVADCTLQVASWSDLVVGVGTVAGPQSEAEGGPGPWFEKGKGT